MAITRDASTTSTSMSFSHTCSGSDRVLLVHVMLGAGGYYDSSDYTVSGVTYNGVAMTKASGAGNASGWGTWYLVNPATGSNTVSISQNGLGGAAIAVSYNGVLSVGASASAWTNAYGSPSTSVTTTYSGSWLAGMAYDSYFYYPTVGTDTYQVAQVATGFPANMIAIDSNGPKAGPASYSLACSFNGGGGPVKGINMIELVPKPNPIFTRNIFSTVGALMRANNY